MTVEELIKELYKYNPKLEVVISPADAGCSLDYDRGEIEFQTGHTQTVTTRYGSGCIAREERLIKSDTPAADSVLVIRQ